MLVSTSVQFWETSVALEHDEPELADTQFGLPPGDVQDGCAEEKLIRDDPKKLPIMRNIRMSFEYVWNFCDIKNNLACRLFIYHTYL
jgi:hypothetical protein